MRKREREKRRRKIEFKLNSPVSQNVKYLYWKFFLKFVAKTFSLFAFSCFCCEVKITKLKFFRGM